VSLPELEVLRRRLEQLIVEERTAGVDVDDLLDRARLAPESYDALDMLARELACCPMRADWPYDEPDELDAIWSAADPARCVQRSEVPHASERVAAAFTGSVCGCMLGKPVEIDPTLAELREVLAPRGQWPLHDYVTEDAIHALRWQQFQWRELARDRIDHVAADDDINYTVLGMLVLEKHGVEFTREQLRFQWLRNLPVLQTFGPERTMLLAAGGATLDPNAPFASLTDEWRRWNMGAELCGALIRADAYGYACLGDPALAAELAWRDAGATHRRTGIYGAMFVAAAIATAPTCDDPLDIVRIALGFVPQRSRFAEAVRFALDEVATAETWLDGYERIHARYGEHGHCRILQEIGTLVNTLRFADDVGDGICIQVMQGNDTDSFGATAGSILGAWFGPGHLEERWVAPFGDRIQLSMAMTWESSLSALTARMAALPGRHRMTSAS
jgi:ADP-ribosylglycohydrolase